MYSRVGDDRGAGLSCARESGHDGPHVNCYEKYWAWHEADHKQPGCKFVTEWGGALPAVLYCGRPAGHEGLHCTHSQLDASWFERPNP